MDAKKPFFSIVIANYNYGHLLEATLQSVFTQDDDDYEVIVVDGGSTDNSLEIISRYQERIAWWVSEPDRGQSHAFNKGFAHARGRFLTWLNADDLLLPGTIAAVKQKLLRHPEASWATGNMLRFMHEDGRVIEAPWGPHCLPGWLQGIGRITIIFGPSTFWSRKSYAELGPIDEDMHLAMDVDYWTRLNVNGYRQVRVNHCCWAFRMHEDSKTAEFAAHEKTEARKLQMKQEKQHIIEKYGYRPSKFWRMMGLLMRCLDGSMLVAVLKHWQLIGKPVAELYRLPYNIK